MKDLAVSDCKDVEINLGAFHYSIELELNAPPATRARDCKLWYAYLVVLTDTD